MLCSETANSSGVIGKTLNLLCNVGVIAVETRGCYGFGVFDKAVFSWFDTESEEHDLTEDGKTVVSFLGLSVSNANRHQQRKYPNFNSLPQAGLAVLWKFLADRNEKIRSVTQDATGITSGTCEAIRGHHCTGSNLFCRSLDTTIKSLVGF